MPRRRQEPADESLADALSLEAGDGVEPRDLAGARFGVGRREQARESAPDAVPNGRAEADREQLRDLLGRPHLQDAFTLAALDQPLGLGVLVDAERLDMEVLPMREERARADVGEELLGDPLGGAQVHRLDPAA